MADASVLGRILWYELLTSDVDAAEAFYKKVVGWTVTPFKGGDQRYDMWARAGGKTIGGVMKLPKGMNVPPHWGMYVGVPKLEDGVARVEKLGGSALSPVIDIPDVGRTRTMKDPQGAMFSVYEPANAPQAEAPPEMGDGSWHELYTTDAESALKFYGDLFGWKPTETMDMGPAGKYYMFGRGWPLGGMMNKTGEMVNVMPTAWSFYFRVPDIDAGAEKIKANGGKIVNGPMEVPGGDRIVMGIDPQGAAFNLHQKK